jgi:hypothetical protein
LIDDFKPRLVVSFSVVPRIFKNAIIALGYAVRPVGDARSVEDCMDGQFGTRLPDAPRAAGYGSRHYIDQQLRALPEKLPYQANGTQRRMWT